MKKILIWLIKKYQTIPGTFHQSCRFIPTCSNYAIEAIEIHGSIYGLFLTIKRILKCNPIFKPGFDPVPKKKKEVQNEKNSNYIKYNSNNTSNNRM